MPSHRFKWPEKLSHNFISSNTQTQSYIFILVLKVCGKNHEIYGTVLQKEERKKVVYRQETIILSEKKKSLNSEYNIELWVCTEGPYVPPIEL